MCTEDGHVVAGSRSIFLRKYLFGGLGNLLNNAVPVHAAGPVFPVIRGVYMEASLLLYLLYVLCL